MEKEFWKKLIEGMVRIYNESMKDEMMYGSSFIKFSDRKIELLDPIEKLKKIGRKIVKDKRLMPEKFKELAEYNTRQSKGIVHTKEYRLRMEILQEQYFEWLKKKN